MLVIEIIILSYFTFAVVHTLMFAIAGNFRRRVIEAEELRSNSMAVLIPSYKEDEVILQTAQLALQQNYPSAKFSVIVIADSLKEATLLKLSQLPIKLIKVSFDKSTKAKSLNAAMAEIGDEYDIAVVLDADNVMEEEFLSKINQAYNAGYVAIQGRRVAKNMNTSFAILDTISEVINNHIFRKGHTALGLSSAVIGSGMAFDYRLFKSTLDGIQAVGGFDRELQLAFIGRGQKILYLEDAIVFDEKIEKSSTFENQRKRWLASQFIYLKKYFFTGVKHLFKGNYDFFHMGVLNNILLPRVLMLGLITVITMLAVLFKNYTTLPYYFWLVLFGLYILTFFLSIPGKLYNKKLLKAIFSLPQAFVIMFISLFKLKGANRQFIHTPHSNVKVDKSLIN
ncbi:MAG TPA: glycosyltransferase family 2 protein [Cytophagales bacterium]|nr:glycosyltransferase family 2 protein [Cytophagales bacterium]